jgi:hypothetical protein
MNAGNDREARSQKGDLRLQEVVGSAGRELGELLQERDQVMKRIGTIKQTLAGLAQIFGDSILSDELQALLHRGAPKRRSGFTRACRVVLMESVEPLGARQICDHLRRRFPDLLEHHKDPVASTTTVLSRLVEYSEARCFFNPSGRRVWEWITEEKEEITSPQPAGGA